MASLVDSRAHFDQRLADCRVPASLKTALINSGIVSLATLSHSFGQPGQAIDDNSFRTWVLGLDPAVTIGGTASLKRLLLESQTQLLALLKGTGDTA